EQQAADHLRDGPGGADVDGHSRDVERSPTSFHYSWSRCDGTGAACLAISGATGKMYTVTTGDVGHTLRVTVTARNADGAASATSAATTVVPPSGCPSGGGAIQSAALAPPGRLIIAAASLASPPTR